MKLPAPSIDRLLYGSPLRHPRYARLVVGALALVLLFAVAMVFSTIVRLSPGVLQVFLTALGVASIASLIPITILWFLDRRERESPWLFAIAFLWGGLIATGLALPLNTLILGWVEQWVELNPEVRAFLGPDAALMIGAPIAAPLVEEITKGLGVLALFVLLRGEFDNMRDGLIYGALIGAGFTWLETSLYVAKGYAELGVAPWAFQFGYRYALFGLGGHALYSGLFGAALGLARQMRPGWLRWIVPPVGLLLGIAAHALNNSLGLLVTLAQGGAGEQPTPEETAEALTSIGVVQAWVASSIAQLVIFLPFVAVAAVALWRSGVWERRVIREELAAELPPTVTLEELEQIQRDGIFRTRRIKGESRRRSAALVNAQHELAFRKRRVRLDGANPEADPLVAGWRGEIERLRKVTSGE